jgi:hypothetical protein
MKKKYFQLLKSSGASCKSFVEGTIKAGKEFFLAGKENGGCVIFINFDYMPIENESGPLNTLSPVSLVCDTLDFSLVFVCHQQKSLNSIQE